MSDLGKIFIFEKNPYHLRKYVPLFEEHGFFPFGTDNLYSLIQYSKEVKPDIIIINIPKNHTLSENDIDKIENMLCKTGCPNIYINQHINSDHSPNFNYWDFDKDISYEQILSIIKQSMTNKTLH